MCYNNNRKEVIQIDKIDKRRHYLIVVDTETTNSIQDGNKLDMTNVLVYDCGWQIVDWHGRVYKQASYVNSDIFLYEKELMQAAFFANKIPQYEKDIQEGRRIVANTYQIRKAMLEDMEQFGVNEMVAHNARFDLTALNSTQRYITKSKFRYWFPYGTKILDTMRMAESVILKMETYKQFCKDNGYLTATGRLKKTAEILWRFISRNTEFQEAHTGLEDAQIETKIMAYCFKQYKHLEKELFAYQKNIESPTMFQRYIARNMRKKPILRIGK